MTNFSDKGRAAFHQELMEATIKQRRKLDGAAFDESQLNTEQIGFLAAKSALKFDTTLTGARKAAAKVEAMRILSVMLGKSSDLATRFRTSGIEVVIVSADRPMTALPEFASLSSTAISQAGAAGTRGWDETRGVGGLALGGKLYVAITEENLVGSGVGAAVTAIGGGCYAPQYSTSTHEFAHALHSNVLDARQNLIITNTYKSRAHNLAIAEHGGKPIIYFDGDLNALKAALATEWVDGQRQCNAGPSETYDVATRNGSAYRPFKYTTTFRPRNCYAAVNEKEYFAQCVNAYLGANGGVDPYVSKPRHNGAMWVRANEPMAMVALLDELFSPHGVSVEAYSGFGQALLEETNKAAPASGRKYMTVGELIAKRKRAKLQSSSAFNSKKAFFEKFQQGPGKRP